MKEFVQTAFFCYHAKHTSDEQCMPLLYLAYEINRSNMVLYFPGMHISIQNSKNCLSNVQEKFQWQPQPSVV